MSFVLAIQSSKKKLCAFYLKQDLHPAVRHSNSALTHNVLED